MLLPLNPVVLANPIAGRGRAVVAARQFAATLGASVFFTEPDQNWWDSLPNRIEGAQACIVLGGDGTLHSTLPALVQTGVPVYQVGMGTENLFAREFGMKRDLESVRRALDSGRCRSVDVGMAQGRPFSLMCSAGPDAGVVARLAAARRGAITHLAYLWPIAQELASPILPSISLTVDNKEIVRNEAGWLVVANCPQYGGRVDPARRARMDDGLLDVVFFPAGSGVEALRWLIACMTRRQHLDHDCIYTVGRDVEIQHRGGGWAVQLDGDTTQYRPQAGLHITVRPSSLNVLLPA